MLLSRLIPAVLLVTMVGCCSHCHTAEPATHPSETAQRLYVPPAPTYSTASALVFDPPASRYLPPLDLSRDGRTPAAFAGFQQASNTFTYTFTDDHQSTYFRDSYDRHTFSVQVGSSVR